MAPRILCIGECMAELSGPDGARRLGFGGDTLNTAVLLARLLGPGQVGYLTRLGDDIYSAAMRRAWEAEGIDCTLVETAPGATVGLYAIETDATGERSFTYWRDTAPARGLMTEGDWQTRLQAIASADALFVTGITLAILPEKGRERLIAAVGRAKAAGALVAVDPNHRPRLWSAPQAAPWIEAAYSQATVALTSREEEETLFGPGDPVERLSAWGVTEVVLKAGDRGASLRAVEPDGTEVQHTEPAPPVAQIVDTTGAGDAFNAGYLAHRLLRGPDPAGATRAACALGAVAIQHPGAIVPPAATEALAGKS